MKVGNFYFLNDDYFTDFPDSRLMLNREVIQGIVHDRPSFYAFNDGTSPIFWLIPISSQVAKYKRIYNSKIKQYGRCDTIVFGYVLGHEKAFLIQNMCPAISIYIKNEYIDSKAGVPVRVDGAFERELITKAKKVLALQRKGFNLIFLDVLKIENELMKKLQSAKVDE